MLSHPVQKKKETIQNVIYVTEEWVLRASIQWPSCGQCCLWVSPWLKAQGSNSNYPHLHLPVHLTREQSNDLTQEEQEWTE